MKTRGVPHGVLRGARAAIVFLTRVPVGGFPYSRVELAWAAAWFPAVGTALGAALAGVWTLCAPLGNQVAALAAVGAGILLTGALHEDGLADTADALGGAASRDAVFRILKDSRIGTYGALALVLSVAFRGALLAGLGPGAPAGLALAHTLARASPVWLVALLPYVSPAPEAKSAPIARASYAQATVATVWTLGVLVGLALFDLLEAGRAALLLGAAAASTALCGWRFHARVGGITGDMLGAAEQIGEVVVLAVLVAGPSRA